MDCLFCKIAHKEINTEIIEETNRILVFPDLHPVSPKHFLIIPKEHISTLNDALPQHESLLGELLLTATKLAKKYNYSEDGYRVVMNCNKNGGQSVYHMHLHFIGGRAMQWPPG